LGSGGEVLFENAHTINRIQTAGRPLGTFELAQMLTDDYAPFNVVAVFKIKGGLSAQELRSALVTLQQRHAMLRVRIVQETRLRRFFVDDQIPAIPLIVSERTGDEQWLSLAEEELGQRIETAVGPLMRCRYLCGAGQGELIVTFLHAIMDAASGAAVVNDLLSLLGGVTLPEPDSAGCLIPPAEAFFPQQFTGWRRCGKLARFLIRLLLDEVRYRLASRYCRKAPVHRQGRCRVLTLELDDATTSCLARRARQQRVSLNSVLNAALLLATRDQLYHGHDVPMRALTFPVLRAFLKPRVPDDTLASYFVALRLTFYLRQSHDLWTLAADIHQQIHRAAKRGDKFSFHCVSTLLMRLVLSQRSQRMGHTALAFMESTDMETSFGRLFVSGMHAFVSNFTLGPELAAQARVFQNRLGISMMYLDSDMSSDQAQTIAEVIRELLSN
jgi:hypothetical protein